MNKGKRKRTKNLRQKTASADGPRTQARCQSRPGKQYSRSSHRGEEEDQCPRNRSKQQQSSGEITSPRENDKQKNKLKQTNEPTELIEPRNRQEEREKDQMEQYAQELVAAKDDEDKSAATRKHTLWGDIRLFEYNQETRTWGCRIGDCEAKIETEKTYIAP